MRLLLFGDGRWASVSLARLLADGHDVGAVVLRATPSDPGLAALAEESGIDILQPARVNDPAFRSALARRRPELNVSISYDQIIRRELIDAAPLGFINFHAGMLPFYRGRSVVNWAIINGEEEIGLTSYYIDEGIDTGPIIDQHGLPIGWTDSYGDVLDKLIGAFPDFVSRTLGIVRDGTREPKPQAHLVGTYFPARGEGDEWIDWSDTSRNIHNKIRAIALPGPGARTSVGGQEVTVWKAFYDPAWPVYVATPGQVVARTEGSVRVKTGDSTVLLHEIQHGSAPRECPRWRIGTRLGGRP